MEIHPDVVFARDGQDESEVNFFDKKYEKGFDWYK